MSVMKEKVEILTVSELCPLFNELEAIKSIASTLRKNSAPMFHGKRFLTDTTLCQKLKICKRTLAAYRANGMLAYYNLPGKILYSDTDVEDFLQRHYLPPFR